MVQSDAGKVGAGRVGARRVGAWLGACTLAMCSHAYAQDYPSKSVRWIVPSAAGGAFDLVTRGLAPAMTTQMGQTFYVDSIGGAAGLLGMETAARAAPDGYTILTAGTSQLVFNQFFHKTIPYDPVKDYDGVTLLGDLPIALWVHASVPVKSFPELLKHMRANPGKLNYGSSGVGHLFHLGMEMLEEKTGAKATHVPYKGVGPAIREFLSGRLQLMFTVSQRPVMAQYKAGKILPLVGGTGKRLSTLPNTPTFNEMGVPGMDLPNWVAMVVPKGTPKEVVARLNREAARALQSDAARKTYEGLAMEAMHTTPAQFEAQYKAEIAQWGPFIKRLGIQPQ